MAFSTISKCQYEPIITIWIPGTRPRWWDELRMGKWLPIHVRQPPPPNAQSHPFISFIRFSLSTVPSRNRLSSLNNSAPEKTFSFKSRTFAEIPTVIQLGMAYPSMTAPPGVRFGLKGREQVGRPARLPLVLH